MKDKHKKIAQKREIAEIDLMTYIVAVLMIFGYLITIIFGR